MINANGIAAAMAVIALAAASIVVVQQAPTEEAAPAGAVSIDAGQAATFTGTRGSTPQETVNGTSGHDDGVISNRGQVANGILVESSDERFSGSLDFTMHEDKYTAAGAGVFWGDQTLRNEDGAWQGVLVGAGNPTVGDWRASVHMVGSGAYDGLVAIVFFDSNLTHEGVILPGPLPPRE